MKIVILGGKLQGTEIAYLAKEAGFHSVLVDKTPGTPASGLCDEEFICDITERESRLIELLKSADIVIPALENPYTIDTIDKIGGEYGINIAFDFAAYRISSSKLKSDVIFAENNIPHPEYYPKADPPYVLKPSNSSGSDSVSRMETRDELERAINAKSDPENWVAQEYLTGLSYSIEVIGKPGEYKAYEITQIHLDESYDCNLVTAPVDLPEKTQKEFIENSIKLAEIINLNGIMDVEAIEHNGVLKVIEIDARFPSQTPIAVYYSTGVNMLEELAAVFTGAENHSREKKSHMIYASYENFQCENGIPSFGGEHTFGSADPLDVKKDFLGADCAITDYSDGKQNWQAVFVNTSDTKEGFDKKRSANKEKIIAEC